MTHPSGGNFGWVSSNPSRIPSRSYPAPFSGGSYSYPPSGGMFGSSSPFGGTYLNPSGTYRPGSYAPPPTPPQEPDWWDKFKKGLKKVDFSALAPDYTPQKPALGPTFSTNVPRASARGYRNVPQYQPPMPMRMDVAALLQLIQQAQKSRGNAIRRFNINPIV